MRLINRLFRNTSPAFTHVQGRSEKSSHAGPSPRRGCVRRARCVDSTGWDPTTASHSLTTSCLPSSPSSSVSPWRAGLTCSTTYVLQRPQEMNVKSNTEPIKNHFQWFKKKRKKKKGWFCPWNGYQVSNSVITDAEDIDQALWVLLLSFSSFCSLPSLPLTLCSLSPCPSFPMLLYI